ncbi:thioredoxin domain-containing protein [Magnetospirillum molischianum]|uniref:Spermatogenesis-associated protein 20-like TRX domain-containing protein n=1 Tax=Magnetospirillum molischianum DSM 120 TaxID=1150626 RepID=H8FTE8_MAGML|nr:thioredoxin domain-containing protein [Magnetospirillum molischianum]CCG41636.1 conserved hypothetical protein [Magnetospirillum molischianum DSM 120]
MPVNRLAAETSPYLLHHATDPVAWQTWGAEALTEAKTRNRPILLSIGYSACHWCHVMANESFRDPAIAARINDGFVAIKVDREERPDLDSVYQHALAMMGQPGGWPLTLFLTPETIPFWGGTYFPPMRRYGRPSFAEVLDGIATAWNQDDTAIVAQTERMRTALAPLTLSPGGDGIAPGLGREVAEACLPLADPVHGGFGAAPKFPQPALLRFLWRSHLAGADQRLGEQVILTLDRLCGGGICDQLGGGFMRYATDSAWIVPHFEKMLYDNAQLIGLLTEVWRRTGSPRYRQAVAEAIEWLQREMRIETGGFAAALDADSDGEEGAFYTWSVEEIESALPPALAGRIRSLYDIRPGGNWESRSILHRNHPHGNDDETGLNEARALLLAKRSIRPRPARDDKILTDWNGMTIRALAEAGLAFDRPDWIETARAAFASVAARATLPGGRLAHVWCAGRVGPVGVIDDYAHLAAAAIALYTTDGDKSYLDQAQLWLNSAHDHHWDQDGNGYFLSADDAADVPIRTKPFFDSVVPSGNGAMAEVLALMHLVSGEAQWHDRAEATLSAFSAALPDQGTTMAVFLDARHLLDHPLKVTIFGPANDPAAAILLRTAITSGQNPLIIREHGPDSARAHVCRGPFCLAPIDNPSALEEILNH